MVAIEKNRSMCIVHADIDISMEFVRMKQKIGKNMKFFRLFEG